MSTELQTAVEAPAVWYVAEDDAARLSTSAAEALGLAQYHGYDFITVPITTPSYQQKIFEQVITWNGLRSAEEDRNPLLDTNIETIDLLTQAILTPLSPEDTYLVPGEANAASIGKVSAWIALDSTDPLIAHVSRQVFKLELAYAAFCGLQHVIIRGPSSEGNIVQYARTILEGLGAGPYLNLYILMPMEGELEHDYGLESSLSELAEAAADTMIEDESFHSSWDDWNRLRSQCAYNPHLGLALEIPRTLPSQAVQDQWYSEPVRVAVFPRTTFLRNAKGYPVLHRNHQQYLTRLMRLRFPPWLLLADVADSVNGSSIKGSADPTPAEAAKQDKPRDPAAHLHYVRHLQQTQPPKTAIERFGHGYQDYIQSPLQPLTDNLESITYEVFEKDPVKYDWYERATELALRDLYQLLGRTLVVSIVGSGRGPLVSKALLAAKKANVPVKCWAVEKNPNAYVHLQRRNATDELWSGQVTVVKSDMRAWQGPIIDGQLESVDILISELLGSFADNELSPECLDGVQHVLLPEHGINIPQSYSAHFTPISTPRLYNDLLSKPGMDKWEIPVVVMLQQHSFLSKSENSPNIEQAWSFPHPLPAATLERAQLRAGGSAAHGGPGGQNGGDGSNEHNNRYCKKSFQCNAQGMCHGLAGYFETLLYASTVTQERVELSTNPLTMEAMSKDMISWFPIFFPLKTPLYVPAGSTIETSMWRATDDRKVWYEWVVEVHLGGRVLAMSELHSSVKNGCLM